MSFVVDSSMALAWVYADEITPTTMKLFQQAGQTGAWVPVIWHLEVANSLQFSVQRRRIDVEFRDRCLADLRGVEIMVDAETNAFAWTTTLALAGMHRLTMYDASYLELAQRRALPLATLDSDLRKAATAAGVPLAEA